jgi:hypothetical protein
MDKQGRRMEGETEEKGNKKKKKKKKTKKNHTHSLPKFLFTL